MKGIESSQLTHLLFTAISCFFFSLPIHSEQLNWVSHHSPTNVNLSLKNSLLAILNQESIQPKRQIGLAILNLKTGEQFSINGDQPFFMASTYKIAIAVKLLSLVDQHQISLDQMIPLKPNDIVPGSGILVNYFKNDTLSLSVNTLLKLMLQQSDNTATDLILRLVGGPAAVNKKLQELAISQMSVDRSTLEFTRDYFNVQLPPLEKRNYTVLLNLYLQGHPTLDKFLNDTRDTATPNAMLKLLQTIYEGKALSPQSTKQLLTIMSNRQIETGRLYQLLPEVTVYQKLGTGEQVVNDIGIIQLPEKQGAFAIVIFQKYVDAEQVIKDNIPALLAKTAYDYFLFTTSR